MTEAAVVLDEVDRGYRGRRVLCGFSCRIPEGPTTALLGPNGAGKTTLMRVMSTVLAPQAGRVTILGFDGGDRGGREAIRRQIGYLPQNFTADESLTTLEYVEYCLWLRGKSGREARALAPPAIELLALGDQRNRRLRTLSGGMRQRAGIAAAIAGAPRLLLLDEPTVGLDPEQRAQFRQVLDTMHDSTIVISTHLLEDAVESADHLVVVNAGQAVYSGESAVLTVSEDRSIQTIETAYTALLRGVDAPAV